MSQETSSNGQIGGGSSSGSSFGEPPSSSATAYWFLGGDDDGYRAEVAELVAEFLPEYTATDTGLAMFLMVTSCGFLVLMAGVLWLFFRKRNVFEIRARSANLAMLSGVCMMASMPLTILAQSIVLFGYNFNLHAFYMLYFFILVCGISCYGSRTIRLAVLYNGRVRKSVPWLAWERNHAYVCVLLGLASLGFPLYHKHNAGDSPFALLFFASRATDTLWAVTIACQVMVLALYPLVWKTEDIFNIALELRVTLIAALLVTVAGRLGENHLSYAAARWMNSRVMGFIVANIMFLFSLGLPIRQLLLHPLESSDPKIADALRKRKQSGAVVSGGESMASTRADEDPDSPSDVSGPEDVTWTYEKVAAMPEVSAAFEDFTRKALCQESLLFLRDVTEFQLRHSQQGRAGGGAWDGAGLGVGDDDDDGGKHLTFNAIVERYIIDGAPDEVNISSTDKNKIVRVYEAGRSGFDSLSAREQRFVFARAYAEVRFILESNLMNRFLTTGKFKAALIEDQANEDWQA
ncbi:unnamed protein product [Scytosiphon promiscuus]